MSQELRDKVDIVEVVSEHTTLKRKGAEWRGPCPIHGGSGPNLSVNPEKQVYVCHTCKSGGSVIDFIMDLKGKDYIAAVEDLGGETFTYHDDHSDLRDAVDFCKMYFCDAIRPHEYLKERGLPLEWCQERGVGYCNGDARLLIDTAEANGIPESDLREIGVINDNGLTLHNRITFTLTDHFNRNNAFSGRGDYTPKWLHTRNSPIHSRRSFIYGLNECKGKELVLVEGISDSLCMRYMGFGGVASLGTSFTNEQGTVIANYANSVRIMFDPTALEYSFKAADVLLSHGVQPYICYLEGSEDPGCSTEDWHKDNVRKAVAGARDVIEEKIRILSGKGALDSIEGRRIALDKLMQSVRTCSDAALRDMYMSQVAEAVQVNKSTVEALLNDDSKESIRVSSDGGVATAEEVVISFCRSDDSLLEKAMSDGIEEGDFYSERWKREYRELVENYGSDRVPVAHGFDEEDWEYCYTTLLSRARNREIKKMRDDMLMADDKMSILRKMVYNN